MQIHSGGGLLVLQGIEEDQKERDQAYRGKDPCDNVSDDREEDFLCFHTFRALLQKYFFFFTFL